LLFLILESFKISSPLQDTYHDVAIGSNSPELMNLLNEKLEKRTTEL